MVTLNDLFKVLTAKENIGWELEKGSISGVVLLSSTNIPTYLKIEELKDNKFKIRFGHFANLVNKEAFSNYIEVINNFNVDVKDTFLYLQNQTIIAEYIVSEIQDAEEIKEIMKKLCNNIMSIYPKLMHAQWGMNS